MRANRDLLIFSVLTYCLLTSCAGWDTTASTTLTIEQLGRSTRSASVPLSLRHIYVCVTFHWEVQSLIFLRQVISTMQQYPTKLDYCVLTNQPERLRLAMKRWASPKHVCGTQKNMSHPFKLAWEHRAYMEEAFQRRNPEYTAFMYLESDIRVPWRTLLGWAADEPILAPLGFQRAFYRVEPIEKSGRLGLTDQIEHLHLATYPGTVRARATVGGNLMQEKHFLQMPNPYMGMWIADRNRMAMSIASPYWTKTLDPWEIREMAACGLQFVTSPEGFFGSAVVPYNPFTGQLDADSAIDHLSNKYCGDNTQDGIDLDPKKRNNTRAMHCNICVDEFLVV